MVIYGINWQWWIANTIVFINFSNFLRNIAYKSQLFSKIFCHVKFQMNSLVSGNRICNYMCHLVWNTSDDALSATLSLRPRPLEALWWRELKEVQSASKNFLWTSENYGASRVETSPCSISGNFFRLAGAISMSQLGTFISAYRHTKAVLYIIP